MAKAAAVVCAIFGSHAAVQALLVFFPAKLGNKDKSKQQDDAMNLGNVTHQYWLGNVLLNLATRCHDAPLFSLELFEYQALFRDLCIAAGLEHLDMVPHGLRQGGANLMATQMKRLRAWLFAAGSDSPERETPRAQPP